MSSQALTTCNFSGNTDCNGDGRAFGIMDTKGNCVTLGMPQVNLIHALTNYEYGPSCVNPTMQCSENSQDFLSVGIVLVDPSPFTDGPYYSSTYSNGTCAEREGQAPLPCIMKNAGGTEIPLPCLYKSAQCSFDDFAESGLGSLGGNNAVDNRNISSVYATTHNHNTIWIILGIIFIIISVGLGLLYATKKK